jgi:hypothetical protein
MGRMDDHPNEHEAEAEAGVTGDAVPAVSASPAEPIAQTAGVEPASPVAPESSVASTLGELGTPPASPDPWALFVHDQDVRLKAASQRRTRRRLIASGAAVVIIAAAVAGVAASGGRSAPGSGMAPADFVVSSTQTTLAQRTADVTFSGNVSADGKDIPINGTGQVDFDTNAFTATMSESVASTSIAIRELIASGQFFMGMTIDGQDMSTVTGGAHWVGISLPDQASSSSLGATNVDPIGQLKALEQKGVTVTSLGTKTIDGTTVSGYSVTPSHQEIENNIQQEIQQNQMSAAQGQQLLQSSNLISSFTTEVWIDGSGLIRQEDANIGGGSAGINAKVTMSFQNYGTPVSIATPAPNDVIPFTQFLSDLKAAQASSQG